MSIVPLVKVTLYGPAADKDAVLDGLQRLGCLHLNDLHRGDAEAVDLTPRRSDAREALQYLHDSPVHRRALRHGEKVDYEVDCAGGARGARPLSGAGRGTRPVAQVDR